MELNSKNLLKSHLKVIPKTRNRRFREALERNHAKKRQGGKASTAKKLAKLRDRSFEIQEDKDRLEILHWITEIQQALGYTDQQFADSLNVHKKTVQNWRNRVGYLPSIKNFRRLLQLEKLTRVSIVIKKNKNFFIKERAAIKVVIR